MERYPLSTHSSKLALQLLVVGTVVFCVSYLITLEEETIFAAARGVEVRLSEKTRGALSTVRVSPAARSLGPWRVEKNYLVDETGTSVQLKGINWSGCETPNKIPGGLDRQDYRAILNAIKRAGFNVVRIPFSNAMVETPTVPTAISFEENGAKINDDLRALDSLGVLDQVIKYSGSIGLRVILDNHRSTAGGGPQENGLWFTEEFPETSWLDDWLALARRYRMQNAVIGFDLRNEPHSVGRGGACWSCGGSRDWHLAAERAGNKILAEDASKLIIVEGVDVYRGDISWWGGNLEGVEMDPVKLSLPNHLVYSAHEYGPMEYSQPWFNANTTPATLQALWDKRWGFIEEQGIAPVFIGEFGTPRSILPASEASGSQNQWFVAFTEYLQTRPHFGWSYWSANAEDRYAFFKPDYVSGRADLLPLQRLMANRKALTIGIPSPQLQPSRKLPVDPSCERRSIRGAGPDACFASVSAAPERQHGDEDFARSIARDIDRATQDAVRTLSNQHP